MKLINVLLILLLVSSAYAQAQLDNRWQIQISGLYAYPTGEFNHKHSSSEYLGQTRHGVGGNLLISKPIYKGFGLGLSIVSIHYRINKDNVQERIQTIYNPNKDHFVTTSFKNSFQASQIAMELFKNFSLKSVIIRPFIRLGLGGISNIGDVDIRLKKRDDNYSEAYKLTYTTDSGADTDNEFHFFYPSLGADISFPVNDYIYCHAGVLYSHTKVNIRRTVYFSNIFNESDTGAQIMAQTLSSLQLFTGISIKFGRRR